MKLHIQKAKELFGHAWQHEFDQLKQSIDTDSLTESYNQFCRQCRRDQTKYNLTGEWPRLTYQLVNQSVYQNTEHMQTNYLPGLLLSHWLWPHHYRQMQFFCWSFLSHMVQAQATEYLEVGVGSGAYSWQVLQQLPDCDGLAIDISPASLDFAQKLNPTLTTKCIGIEQQADASTSWLICVEVLEHLEDPVTFLKELHRVLAPGGRAFVTAAVNSASYDHIWLYHNAHEVAEQISQAGFHIEQYWTASAHPPRNQRQVPQVAAFVVTHI